MQRLYDFIGMSVGGWAGWKLGAFVSLTLAFILGIIGTGVGLYVAKRIGRNTLP